MELKQYQRRVLENIRSYAEKYVALGNATAAYDAYLANDGLVPGKDGVPRYHDRLHGVPDVCVKVPTGGGKPQTPSAFSATSCPTSLRTRWSGWCRARRSSRRPSDSSATRRASCA